MSTIDEQVPGARRATAPATTPTPTPPPPASPLLAQVSAIKAGDRVKAEFFTFTDQGERSTYTVEGMALAGSPGPSAKIRWVGMNCLRSQNGHPHVSLSRIIEHDEKPALYTNQQYRAKPNRLDIAEDRNRRTWVYTGEWWESYSKPATSTEALVAECGPLKLVGGAI